MPRLPTLILICSLILSGYAPVAAQSLVQSLYSGDSLTIRRWFLSFNPLGIVEEPYAIGCGIGYRPTKRTEIWFETSLLRGGITFPNENLTGFRQIIRFALLPPKSLHIDPNIFLAVELRYKTYSYRDTGDFQDPATQDRVINFHFLSKHYIFGGAVQGGYRREFNGHWIFEVALGLGVKYKQIIRQGPSIGYRWLRGVWSTDLNIRDMVETPGYEPYVPGSLRILYAFGRKLR